MTSSQKEDRKQRRERGEAVQQDQIFDEKGKAIGRTDSDGNFLPYKARGRPLLKDAKAKNL